ncbi:unknown [Bacteroides sp. CAG:770]|nr:unknown [Bacteroides sp. CAG:770]
MDFRIFLEVSTDNVSDFTCRTLTVLHTSKVDIHRYDVRTVGLHTCERIVRIGLTECVAANLDFRDFLTDSIVEVSCELTCNLLRCTCIEFDGNCQTALVSMWEVLCLEAWAKQENHSHEDAERTEDDGLSVSHCPVDDPCISI